MSDEKSVPSEMALRVLKRYAASSVGNRVGEVRQWMNEALSRTHQSEQFLKGILTEVTLLSHGGDSQAKAHADHVKRALDGILRVEKETRALVDGLDHLTRELR